MCTLAQQQQYMCTLAQQNPWQKTWPQPRPFIIRLQTHPRTHIRWDCSANPCVCKTCVRIIQQGLYLRYKQIQGLAQTWAEWPHRPSKVLHRHGRNVLTDHPKSCTNMVEMSRQTIQSLAQTWSECPRRLPAKFHTPKCLHALTPPQRPVKLFRNCLQNIERCFYFSNHRLECVATFFLYIFIFIFFSVIVVVVWKVWQMIWTCCAHGPETSISECGFFVVDCECHWCLSSILDSVSVCSIWFDAVLQNTAWEEKVP